MDRVLFRIPFVISAVLLVSLSSLQAEFVCEGKICGNFPTLIEDLNSSLEQVESRYLKEILKNSTESAFLTNILSSGVGRGFVPRFQMGVGVSVAGGQKESITIETQNLKWENLPNGGFSLSPSLNLDFNLGWVLGRPADSYWNRFTLYLHGLKIRLSQSDLSAANSLDQRLNVGTYLENYGGMLRWQVAMPRPIGSYFFTWNGINLGAGAHLQNIEMQVLLANRNPQKLTWGGIEARWGGDAEFLYKTSTKTYNTDIRTGFGVLYLFHLTLGGGMSWNSGLSEISFQREGPFVLKTGSIASWEIPREFQQFFPTDTLEETGRIGIRSRASGKSRKSLGYGLASIEFQFFGLGLLLEAVYTNPSLAGAGISLRYSF